MSALLIVDLQNDFSENGILPVKTTSQIITTINSLIPLFQTIIFSQDWHPMDHCSFVQNKGDFPPHCVQDTEGAKINKDIILNLRADQDVHYIKKGYQNDTECFSAFYDEIGRSTGLTYLLKSQKIDTIYVCGVAGEYCVKETLYDAIKDRFDVNLIVDAVGFLTENQTLINSYLYHYINNNVWLVDSSELISNATHLL